MIQKYLLRYKFLFGCVFLFIILHSFFRAGLSLIFAKFIDTATLSNGNEEFIKTSVLFFIYIIICVCMDFLRRHFRAYFFAQTDFDIKSDYFKNVLNLEPKDFSKKETAHYLSRFTNDLPIIIREYVMEFFNLMLFFFQVLFTVIAAFYINWIMAIVFILLSFVILIFTSLFEKKFSKLKTDLSEANSAYTTELKSSLWGFDEIKFNLAEKKFSESFDNSLFNVKKLIKKRWDIEALYSPGCAFLTYLMTFFSIIISTVLFANNFFSVGMLAAAIYISTAIFNPISNLFEQLTFMKSNKDLAKQIYDELEIPNQDEKINLKEIAEIEIKNLSFKYPETDKLIFKNFNCKIEKGKKYLLIGESGKGKSTLLKIIMGQLDFDGEITVNGLDISKADKKSLYSNIAYVSQSSYIFNKTIRENIDLTGDCTDEEISGLIDSVKLNRFVTENRIDSIVSEDVFQVSGGEKQRICLARALSKNPTLLLLDEVTASLDQATTTEIEKLIANIGITTIYICHKASKSLYESFDYVIEMTDEPKVFTTKSVSQ